MAGFDAATIATTHQFCQLVLKSLGVAGDSDSRVTLVESLTDLVTEVVDDLYLAHFGQQRDDPELTYPDALKLAREVVGNPATELRPLDPEPDSRAAICIRFANDVLAELEIRKRRLGILGYDDLLTRLAEALERRGLPRPPADAPALAHRDGRRVPGHRPRAVAGDRPRVQRTVDGDPDRRPEAGDLRLPRR